MGHYKLNSFTWKRIQESFEPDSFFSLASKKRAQIVSWSGCLFGKNRIEYIKWINELRQGSNQSSKCQMRQVFSDILHCILQCRWDFQVQQTYLDKHNCMCTSKRASEQGSHQAIERARQRTCEPAGLRASKPASQQACEPGSKDVSW